MMCKGHDTNCNCDGSCGVIRAHVPGWDKMSQGTKEHLTVLIIEGAKHLCRSCGHCISKGCPTQQDACPINQQEK